MGAAGAPSGWSDDGFKAPSSPMVDPEEGSRDRYGLPTPLTAQRTPSAHVLCPGRLRISCPPWANHGMNRSSCRRAVRMSDLGLPTAWRMSRNAGASIAEVNGRCMQGVLQQRPGGQ